MMIKAVIFDCFGVLLQREGHEFYKSGNPKSVQKQIDAFEEQADLGLISEEEFNKSVAELTGTTAAKVRAETSKYTRNQELLNFALELRSEYQVSMLTNVSKDTIGHFFTTDEQRFMFDDVVISSEVGLIKPDPEIFALAARRLALRPEECIFIDDTAKNCEAAAKSGIQALAYLGNKHTIKMIKMFLAYDRAPTA
jgi:epoxide hydrolase-like predicted phosphatase